MNRLPVVSPEQHLSRMATTFRRQTRCDPTEGGRFHGKNGRQFLQPIFDPLLAMLTLLTTKLNLTNAPRNAVIKWVSPSNPPNIPEPAASKTLPRNTGSKPQNHRVAQFILQQSHKLLFAESKVARRLAIFSREITAEKQASFPSMIPWQVLEEHKSRRFTYCVN